MALVFIIEESVGIMKRGNLKMYIWDLWMIQAVNVQSVTSLKLCSPIARTLRSRTPRIIINHEAAATLKDLYEARRVSQIAAALRSAVKSLIIQELTRIAKNNPKLIIIHTL